MSELITNFTTVSTAILSQVATIAQTITDTPILLLTTCFMFVGGCVGIFSRVLSRR